METLFEKYGVSIKEDGQIDFDLGNSTHITATVAQIHQCFQERNALRWEIDELRRFANIQNPNRFLPEYIKRLEELERQAYVGRKNDEDRLDTMMFGLNMGYKDAIAILKTYLPK